MIVRHAIREGLSLAFAAVMAASMASASCPSMRATSQPLAWKRASWSSEADSSVPPSMVMSLSSNSTIRRDSFRWPASEIASWLMPSIRQPSPANT